MIHGGDYPCSDGSAHFKGHYDPYAWGYSPNDDSPPDLTRPTRPYPGAVSFLHIVAIVAMLAVAAALFCFSPP